MAVKKTFFFFIFFILSPVVISAQPKAISRSQAIEETLDNLEAQKRLSQHRVSWKDKVSQSLNLGEVELSLGLQWGYLLGNTSYDFDHHTSELEYPFNNPLLGGNLRLAYKDWSVNGEIWTQIDEDAGRRMKDKDWNSAGALISYTKSQADVEAFICEGNLQYDFYKKTIPKNIDSLALSELDEIKIGALLGYRYEKFYFDMHDLTYPDLGVTLYEGEEVLTYKVRYYLPYVGIAANVLRKGYGLSASVKYSFYPTAEDIDNHILRSLVFHGDYDKNRYAMIFGINGFWEFVKDWKLKAGADATLIRIDGRTWDDLHDPAWDADQNLDVKQFIYWTGIEYKF